MALAQFTRSANSTRSPNSIQAGIPHTFCYALTTPAPSRLLALPQRRAFPLFVAPPSYAFLRSHDSLCFHRSLHLHDLLHTSGPCPQSAHCPTSIHCIGNGVFYWAIHSMSSQQSLSIWVSHFLSRPDSLLSLHSFHPSRFWKPSFPNLSFERKRYKQVTGPSFVVHAGCKHEFRDNRGQQRLTARDQRSNEGQQIQSNFTSQFPHGPSKRPEGRTSPHKSSIKAA